MADPTFLHTDVGGDPPAGDLVRAARLDGDRSQAAFRCLLEALSRPGSVRRVRGGVLVDGVPPALLLALAIADVEVGVAVLRSDDDADWARLLADATGARIVPIEAAACVTALVAPTPEEIDGLRRGTPLAPETAARLAIQVDALTTDDDGPISLALRGPGVDGIARLGVTGVRADVFEAIGAVNTAFPAGIDTWLVSIDGDVAAMPRSTQIEVVRSAAAATGRS